MTADLLTQLKVVAVTEYCNGELFQILEDDRKLPLPQVGACIRDARSSGT